MKKWVTFIWGISSSFLIWASDQELKSITKASNLLPSLTLEEAEYSYTGINKFQMSELGLGINLTKNKDLSADLYWAHINSTEDSLSISDQIQTSLQKEFNQNSFRFGLNYWNDPQTHIHSLGPGLYWGHSLNDQGNSVEIGVDRLDYQANLISTSMGENFQLTQYRPNFKFSLDFEDIRLKMIPTYSYYLYSRGPKNLVQKGEANSQFFESTLYGSNTSFINGFLKQEYNFNFIYGLSESVEFVFDFGQGQSAVDGYWSQSFGPTLTHQMTKKLNLQLCYNRTIMYGVNYQYWTSGMSYKF